MEIRAELFKKTIMRIASALTVFLTKWAQVCMYKFTSSLSKKKLHWIPDPMIFKKIQWNDDCSYHIQ